MPPLPSSVLPQAATRPLRRSLVLVAIIVLALTAAALGTPSAAVPPRTAAEPARPDRLEGRWDGAGPVRAGARLNGRVVLRTPPAAAGAVRRVDLSLVGARVTAIPRACRASGTLRIRSFVSADGRTLGCELPGNGVERTIRFRAVVDARTDPSTTPQVTATAMAESAPTRDLPARPVRGSNGRSEGDQPAWRLLSSPDFLNADVADLARGPNLWRPGRTENSINDAYRTALDHVLDDWRAQDPLQVLVAGDLVEGWWGTDPTRSGNFGPVDTLPRRRTALVRAARTVYPQYYARFRERGLDVRPAIGDHELGDDGWPREKRELAPTFRREFARLATRTRQGGPRYSDHPPGQHAATAYAWRPRPDLQLISIDPFDITPGHVRLRLDEPQLRWLRGVLQRAQRDGVRWTLVQGHLPILGPVRVQGSSGLYYDRRAAPRLWKLFADGGVDAYLAGEAHDTTATERDGVVQVVHGGAFQFGFTTYLLIDRIHDRLRLTLRDYSTRWDDAPDGSRLWETRPAGLPKIIRVAPEPFTIGTATLTADGHLTDRSGILLPYRPDRSVERSRSDRRDHSAAKAPTQPHHPA